VRSSLLRTRPACPVPRGAPVPLWCDPLRTSATIRSSPVIGRRRVQASSSSSAQGGDYRNQQVHVDGVEAFGQCSPHHPSSHLDCHGVRCRLGDGATAIGNIDWYTCWGRNPCRCVDSIALARKSTGSRRQRVRLTTRRRRAAWRFHVPKLQR